MKQKMNEKLKDSNEQLKGDNNKKGKVCELLFSIPPLQRQYFENQHYEMWQISKGQKVTHTSSLGNSTESG